MFVLFVKGYWPSNPYPFLGGQGMVKLGIKMGLVSETIKILDSTFVDGVSLLDFVYQSYDPKYGSWSGDSLTNIEKALDRAAKTLP